MASTSSIPNNNIWLNHLAKWLGALETGLALLSGFAILSLMVLAVVSVTGRALFGQPLPGYVDWVEQMMPLIALMGIAYTQRQGGHIRMDLLVSRLNGRMLWLLESLTSIAILVLVVLLIWGSWAHFSRSFDWSAPLWSRDSTIDIGIPLWPTKLLIPIALTSLGLRVILQLGHFVRALVCNEPHPTTEPVDITMQSNHPPDDRFQRPNE